MKVYVDELAKSCQKCPFCEYFEEDAHGKGKHEIACYFNGSLGNILYGNQTGPKTCPLETLADHDKKVRAEVVAENQALKARWEKLWDWICDKKPISKGANAIFKKSEILDKMRELELADLIRKKEK